MSPAQADRVLLCEIAGEGVSNPVAEHGGVSDGVNHNGGLEVVIELRLPSAVGIHSEREVDLNDIREHDAVRELKMKRTDIFLLSVHTTMSRKDPCLYSSSLMRMLTPLSPV